MSEEDLEDLRILFFSLKPYQNNSGSLLKCVSSSYPPSWLFPPHSDGMLLFRHTVCLNVWLEVLWLKTHLFYLIQMPIALVGSDWQVDTPVSVTGFCSAECDCRATLTARHQSEESSGLRGKRHPGIFTVSLGLDLHAFDGFFVITTWSPGCRSIDRPEPPHGRHDWAFSLCHLVFVAFCAQK